MKTSSYVLCTCSSSFGTPTGSAICGTAGSTFSGTAGSTFFATGASTSSGTAGSSGKGCCVTFSLDLLTEIYFSYLLRLHPLI